jgi:transposase
VYYSWRRNESRREYLKLHAAIGTIYKAIPSMEVTTGEVGEQTRLENLLKDLANIETVAGDSGYLSRRNCELIEAKGATSYLKPRRHSPLKIIGPPAWKRMIKSYRRNTEKWMKHYHKRSMAETAFSALKRTLGHWLTSTKRDLQKLELMVKVITYNLIMLLKSRQKGI